MPQEVACMPTFTVPLFGSQPSPELVLSTLTLQYCRHTSFYIILAGCQPHRLGEAWLHEICGRPGMQRRHPIWFAWPVHAMHAPV